ncbi:hypothetical protein NDK43_22530 [Neobacillus pocheonensis]|uniref:Uncharacterized protein n=1 Tax=Neobacillus pocheonensis TaxID=363869 RepID=A0ABT0WGF8_9BACI|nr:hypothetical protein [Neobacillus pocheonensis]
MSWVSFICGGMTVLMTYALFNCDQEEGGTIPARGETDLVVNDFSADTSHCLAKLAGS